MGFENQTGDKSLDNLQMSLPSLLTASLDESKFFRVLTWDRIRAALGQMGKDNVQFIDKELGLEICRRSEVEGLAMGTFAHAYELAVNKTFQYLCPIVPLYYYRLAKLYEQEGMKEKAAEQYAKFLSIWGKADPGFKEPAHARARLAKLRRAGTS